ncbi:MAG: hypothetical protein JSS62_07130 [Verrucomicrobia bacterium]|nr:hypothetical protein [Verrucomicrobiota bacterium]MBS0645874.1 hypothetical protein [Verrucomicrobiota bacterium]
MENETLYPSDLLLKADMWLLSTAIFLVLDLQINEYTSLLNESKASECHEIHQLAVGSFQAKNLTLLWDPITYDYWVNPDEFLSWCIKKEICNESTLIDFYVNTVRPDKLSDASSKISQFRKKHPATVSKEKTLALVATKIAKNPDIILDELVNDKQIRSNEYSGSYDLTTLKKWIQEAYPQFRKSVGRPTKSSLKQS